MTDSGKLPTSGYNFERVYTNHQSSRAVAKSSDLAPEPSLFFGWDWRRLSEGHFEVTVQLGIDPSAQRPEEIRVTLSGRFSPTGIAQEVPLESFVRFHAPAILMPFVRDAVASLTTRGFFGQLLLPPMNVQLLMESQDPEKTTGFRQRSDGAPSFGNREDVTTL